MPRGVTPTARPAGSCATGEHHDVVPVGDAAAAAAFVEQQCASTSAQSTVGPGILLAPERGESSLSTSSAAPLAAGSATAARDVVAARSDHAQNCRLVWVRKTFCFFHLFEVYRDPL